MKALLCTMLIMIHVTVAGEAPSGISKSYRLVNLRGPGWEPASITALAWLGDTLVIAEFGGTEFGETEPMRNGKIWFMTGVPDAEGPQDVTRSEIFSDLPQPMGLYTENGELFIHQKNNSATEIWKATRGGAGWSMERVAGGWGEDEGYWFHCWPGGLIKKENNFYFQFTAVPKMTEPDGATQWPPEYKGSVVQLNAGDFGDYRVFAHGMRAGAAIFSGPFGSIMGPDVQGQWKPDNQLIQIRDGRFYGHTHIDQVRGTTSPPAVTMPQGTASHAPGDGVYMTGGPYAGQMFLGDHTYRGMNRYHVESIGGNLQGTVFDFFGTKDLPDMGDAHPWAVEATPDGAGIVFGCAGGWWVAGPELGALGKLVPTGETQFEILAIRNLNATTMEVEFTLPVNTTQAIDPGNWTVNTFTSVPAEAYGAGSRQDNHGLTPTGIALVPGSSTHVHLTFAAGDLTTGDVQDVDGVLQGLGYVLDFEVEVNSAAGEELYDSRVFYTLNQIGPGVDPVPGCMQPGDPNYNPQANDSFPGACANAVSTGYAGPGMDENLQLHSVRIKGGILSGYFTGPAGSRLTVQRPDGSLLHRESLQNNNGWFNSAVPLVNGIYMVGLEGGGHRVINKVSCCQNF